MCNGGWIYSLTDSWEDPSYVCWFGSFGAMPVMIIYAYAMSKILVCNASRQADVDMPVVDIQTVYCHIERYIEYDPISASKISA